MRKQATRDSFPATSTVPLPLFLQTCEAAFATKDRLRAHTVRHEEKVPCHVCGKMLSAAYITDHMKVHSQGPNHVCELCNKGKGPRMQRKGI